MRDALLCRVEEEAGRTLRRNAALRLDHARNPALAGRHRENAEAREAPRLRMPPLFASDSVGEQFPPEARCADEPVRPDRHGATVELEGEGVRGCVIVGERE